MKNYKLDIKEMTEQFNNSINVYADVYYETGDLGDLNNDLTREQMSEMIQNHAFKLGCKWFGDYKPIVQRQNHRFIYFHSHLIKSDHHKEALFDGNENEKIGLEFFSIKPEPKMVTVKMSEEDLKNLELKIKDSFCISYDKWELVE